MVEDEQVWFLRCLGSESSTPVLIGYDSGSMGASLAFRQHNPYTYRYLVIRDAHTYIHPSYYTPQPFSRLPRHSDLDAKRRLTIVHPLQDIVYSKTNHFEGPTHRQLSLSTPLSVNI